MGGGSPPPDVPSGSEYELPAHLPNSCRLCVRHLPKLGTGKVPHYTCEVRVIEQIEELRPQYDRCALRDVGIL
jgi:hypothetical protein